MPVLQAHPHAHSVVVQDNFVTHHDEEFKGLVETAGAIWIHTPPYSPDMNPIELVFAQVKAYLRRHGPRLLLGDPATGIDEALRSVTPEDCRGYIERSCREYSSFYLQ